MVPALRAVQVQRVGPWPASRKEQLIESKGAAPDRTGGELPHQGPTSRGEARRPAGASTARQAAAPIDPGGWRSILRRCGVCITGRHLRRPEMSDPRRIPEESPVKEAQDAVSHLRPQHQHRPGRRAVRIGAAACRRAQRRAGSIRPSPRRSRAFGTRGCAARVAQAYGEHPETAAAADALGPRGGHRRVRRRSPRRLASPAACRRTGPASAARPEPTAKATLAGCVPDAGGSYAGSVHLGLIALVGQDPSARAASRSSEARSRSGRGRPGPAASASRIGQLGPVVGAGDPGA